MQFTLDQNDVMKLRKQVRRFIAEEQFKRESTSKKETPKLVIDNAVEFDVSRLLYVLNKLHLQKHAYQFKRQIKSDTGATSK